MSQYTPKHNAAGTTKDGKKVGGQFAVQQFKTNDSVTLGAGVAGSQPQWSSDQIAGLGVVESEWTITMQNDDGSQVEIPDHGALDRQLGNAGRERMAIPVKVQFEDGSTEQRMVGVEKHGPSGFRALVPDELGEDDERFYHAVTEAADAAYATTDEKSPGTLKAERWSEARERTREARREGRQAMIDFLSDPDEDKSTAHSESARPGPTQGYFAGGKYVPLHNAAGESEISLGDAAGAGQPDLSVTFDPLSGHLNVQSGNPPFDPVAARRRRDEEAGRERPFHTREEWAAARAAEAAATGVEPARGISQEARDHQADTLRNMALANRVQAGEGAPKTRADAMREFNATRSPEFGIRIRPEDEAAPYEPAESAPRTSEQWVDMMQSGMKAQHAQENERQKKREAAAAEQQAARDAAEKARAQEVPAAKIGRFISRGLDKLKGL